MAAPHEAITFINRPEACLNVGRTLVKAQIHLLDPFSRVSQFGTSLVRVDINSDKVSYADSTDMTLSEFLGELLSTEHRDNEKSAIIDRSTERIAAMALVQECPELDGHGRAHGSERLASVVFGHSKLDNVAVMEVARTSIAPWNGVATRKTVKSLWKMIADGGINFGILPATPEEEDGSVARVNTVAPISVIDEGHGIKTQYFALHSPVKSGSAPYVEDFLDYYDGTVGSILRYRV